MIRYGKLLAVATACLAMCATPGALRESLPAPAAAQARGERPGPGIPGRSALAQAAAQPLDSRLGHRRVGGRTGSHLARAPRARLAHRAHRGRAGDRSARPRRRAALPRRPFSSSIRPGRSSATGAVRARDTSGRGRRRGSPSTRKGNVWIAGHGAATRGGWRRCATGHPAAGCPRDQVHPRRQVPAADRPGRQERGQLQRDHAGPAGHRRGGHRQPTRSTSPTATAIAGSSSSTARPAPTSAIGARTARSRPKRPSARTIRTSRRRGSSGP